MLCLRVQGQQNPVHPTIPKIQIQTKEDVQDAILTSTGATKSCTSYNPKIQIQTKEDVQDAILTSTGATKSRTSYNPKNPDTDKKGRV